MVESSLTVRQPGVHCLHCDILVAEYYLGQVPEALLPRTAVLYERSILSFTSKELEIKEETDGWMETLS